MTTPDISGSSGQGRYFIIGGTIKAATSSLFDNLNAHPETCGSRIKETFFFTHRYSGDRALDQQAFDTFFDTDAQTKVKFEASPNYLAYKENIAPRIRQLLPDAKILFVLRNPVDRLYSHYHFAISKLEVSDSLSFEDFVAACELYNQGETTEATSGIPEQHLRALEIGNYGKYLKRYYDVFDAEQIKLVFFDDLVSRPRDVLADICTFIDIDPSFFTAHELGKSNVTYTARLGFLHRYALKLNRRLEPVLRKRPGLKRWLVRLYKGVNQEREGYAPMPETVRRKLSRYYAASNSIIKEMLDRQPYPPWLDSSE